MQVIERTRTQSVEMTDGYLAQQALDGDQDAFARLVERYSTPLFTFVCRFLNDSDAASDVLQHVFLQMYLSLPRLTLGEPLKAWLFRVARNRCLDELRRKSAVHFSALQVANEEEDLSPMALVPDTDPLPEEVAEHHDLQRILQEAIDQLPPKFRSVVLLRYTAQMSFSEIGQTLEMPEATAKTYFQRAKPLLRAALKESMALSDSVAVASLSLSKAASVSL